MCDDVLMNVLKSVGCPVDNIEELHAKENVIFCMDKDGKMRLYSVCEVRKGI
jgi:hypothetical protein